MRSHVLYIESASLPQYQYMHMMKGKLILYSNHSLTSQLVTYLKGNIVADNQIVLENVVVAV